MSFCLGTHLSQRGQVRGPDGRDITQEHNSLKLGGRSRRGAKYRRELGLKTVAVEEDLIKKHEEAKLALSTGC